MKPFIRLKSGAFLSCYDIGEPGGDSFIVSLVRDYSSESERLELLNSFLNEGGLTFRADLFKDFAGRSFFELWVDGRPAGVLAVDVALSLKTKKPYVSIHPLGVFILKEFRALGFGGFMAETTGQLYARNIIVWMSHVKSGVNTFSVRFRADFDSEEGERFFKIFMEQLDESCAAVVAGDSGINLDVSVEADY